MELLKAIKKIRDHTICDHTPFGIVEYDYRDELDELYELLYLLKFKMVDIGMVWLFNYNSNNPLKDYNEHVGNGFYSLTEKEFNLVVKFLPTREEMDV